MLSIHAAASDTKLSERCRAEGVRHQHRDTLSSRFSTTTSPLFMFYQTDVVCQRYMRVAPLPPHAMS